MKCETCEREFTPKRQHDVRFCSSKCSYKFHRKYYILGAPEGLPASTKGALGETLVVSDLLTRGYCVYRSMTPNSPFDLLAYRLSTKTQLRIEVTWGRMHCTTGSLNYTKHESTADHFDHIAVVLSDRVLYFPELPS